MMSLGQYKFSIDTATYHSLRRASSYRWQEQSRLQRQPGQQYLGQGSESVTLNGIILPHYKGGLGQLDDMRKAAAEGVPLMLIAAWQASGEVQGKWCITSIEETQTEFSAAGAPLKIEFNLSLLSYGDNRAISNA